MEAGRRKAAHWRSQEVIAPPARAAIFLVLTVHAGAESDVSDLLADVAGMTRAVGFRSPDGELTCVVGIGAALWDRLYAKPRPIGLHPFRELVGNVHTAVSTPGDLLFHLRARRMDLCFELASQLMKRLSGVEVADEVHGFRYFDERDLLGFVDGTENPSGPDAAAAVYVGEEDAAYRGGSYVVVQKYLHDLDAWNALSVEEQERAFGRHKLSDIEFPDAEKAPNSHLALNTITSAEGDEQKILRDNMPFGRVGSGEFGTYYIGYAATPEVTERMLENMFLGNPPGNYDRILDFSKAVTGGLFFVPTADFLEDPEDPEDPDGQPAAQLSTPDRADGSGPAVDSDGSLGIGSLKRRGT